MVSVAGSAPAGSAASSRPSVPIKWQLPCKSRTNARPFENCPASRYTGAMTDVPLRSMYPYRASCPSPVLTHTRSLTGKPIAPGYSPMRVPEAVKKIVRSVYRKAAMPFSYSIDCGAVCHPVRTLPCASISAARPASSYTAATPDSSNGSAAAYIHSITTLPVPSI